MSHQVEETESRSERDVQMVIWLWRCDQRIGLIKSIRDQELEREKRSLDILRACAQDDPQNLRSGRPSTDVRAMTKAGNQRKIIGRYGARVDRAMGRSKDTSPNYISLDME
jgi:hypothetical protein